MSPAAPEFAFDEAQLDVYGVYELQVLEEVLRQADRDRHDEKVAVVAEKIRAKIGWRAPVPGSRSAAFLRAFYSALRARLEHRMLLGRRKSDKYQE